jgi:hypothetical protein
MTALLAAAAVVGVLAAGVVALLYADHREEKRMRSGGHRL